MNLIPVWYKRTWPYGAWSGTGASKTLKLLQLPAGAIIEKVKIDHSQSFAGGTVSAASLNVESSNDGSTPVASIASRDVFATVGSASPTLGAGPICLNQSSPFYVIGVLTLTGDTTNHLTQGKVTVWIQVSDPK